MGGQLDLLVDGRQYMGQAVVSDPNSHRLDLVATGLPVGSTVEVVGGVIDYAGQDPLTGVLARLPANTFNSSGQASTSFDVSSSMFVRTQVRDSTGRIIGLSNPAYLFQTPPPGGIPPERNVV